MSSKLIDIIHRILKYNHSSVYIAFGNKTKNPYFHLKQLCTMMEYKDYHDAIRNNIDKKISFI